MERLHWHGTLVNTGKQDSKIKWNFNFNTYMIQLTPIMQNDARYLNVIGASTVYSSKAASMHPCAFS